MANCNFVSKSEVKAERAIIQDLLKDVQVDFKSGWGFGFSCGLVGSAKRNLVVKKGKSPWDLDFQIKVEGKKLETLKSSKELFKLKNGIKELLNQKSDNSFRAKLSTSVVTLIKYDNSGDKVRSYDFAIINSQNKILRGKIEKNVQWNDMKKLFAIVWRYKEIEGSKMWADFRSIYLKKKCDNQNKTGYAIFAEAIKETLD